MQDNYRIAMTYIDNNLITLTTQEELFGNLEDELPTTFFMNYPTRKDFEFKRGFDKGLHYHEVLKEQDGTDKIN